MTAEDRDTLSRVRLRAAHCEVVLTALAYRAADEEASR